MNLIPSDYQSCFDPAQFPNPAPFNDNFTNPNYYLISGISRIKESADIIYSPSGNLETITKYEYYHDYLMPSSVETRQSGGKYSIVYHNYCFDYSPGTAFIDDMSAKHILSPIEKVELSKDIASNKFVSSAQLIKYASGLPSEIYKAAIRSAVALSNWKFSNQDIGILPSGISAGNFNPDSKYFKEYDLLSYDNHYNLLERQKVNDIKQSYLWDYSSTYPIAQATNASQSDIAYTSFEADGKGNWTYSGTPFTEPLAPTGEKIYNLSSGNITKSINNATTYIVSYWRPIGLSSLSIGGTISGYPISGRTVNGWKYYEHKISAQSTATITGSGGIDELRLYPAVALMTTYTYEPLIGMTSQCDVNNRITYYEYDGFGRLILVRDQDKNILKQICYNYAGQPEDCGTSYTPPPTAPELTNVTPNGNYKTLLKWINSSVHAQTNEVYRSANDSLHYSLLATLPDNITSYTDMQADTSTLYFYKIKAVGTGGSSAFSNEKSVTTSNIVPSITPIEPAYIRHSSVVQLPVTATSPVPITLLMQCTNLPSFATFQQTGNSKGIITFSPAQSDTGVYSGITVWAYNSHNQYTTEQFTLTVNSNFPPVLDSISNISVNEEQTVQINFSATDQDAGDLLQWSFYGLPNFATITASNRTANVTFSPAYGEADVYNVEAKVSDGKNGKDTSAFVLTVVHVDNPNPDDGTIPQKPRDLMGEFIDNIGTVKLTWANAAYNANRNEVYRSTKVSGSYTLINSEDTTNADSTSYIDNTVAGNSTYYYLVRAVNDNGGANSLIVKVSTPNKTPVIVDTADIYVRSGASKIVNIAATDDAEDILGFVVTGLPAFAAFSENGNGTGVFHLSPVNTAPGNFSATVKVIDNYGAFSQKVINIIVVATDTATYRINFNNIDYPVTDPLWNSFNSSKTGGVQVSANTTLYALKDETGAASALSVKLLNNWPQNYLGVVTGNNSGVYPDAVIATGYYFYVQASALQKTIKIAGLKADRKYDLTFYGNRSFSTDQVTNYTVDAQTVTLNSRNNTSNTVQMTGLSANGQGEIDIVVDAAMTKYAVINAMVIKEYPNN